MCGIIGYIGKEKALSIVIEGLKNLEYRGYDSAGIAFISESSIEVKRCKGKIRELTKIIDIENSRSNIAIGHTRWATHGRPSENNAHPHRSGAVVLVHNGIIENYHEIKVVLEREGVIFSSETDTEVLCHLVEKYHRELPIEDAVIRATKDVKGSYAIAVISQNSPDRIICARRDSPMVLGIGDGEYFVASDIPAFLNYCRNVIYLENDEFAILSRDGAEIRDSQGNQVFRDAAMTNLTPSMAEKGGFKHFMIKEIFEQPRAVADTIRGRFSPESSEINYLEFGIDRDTLRNFKKIFIVACGTSWHSALIGKYMIEELASIPVEVDIASEFRYRKPLIGKGDLFISVTQSGETADTLAAQREAKRLGAYTLTICNVVGSSSAREADACFYTHSGPEIGVASTKAFSTQIISLYFLSIALGSILDRIDQKERSRLLADLIELPGKIESIFSREESIIELAKACFKAEDFLYLARGILYPVALEGALKLKEISYIHAEGYPAGEMKHGPIALIDEAVPVVFAASRGTFFDKTLSNMNEIRSRGGKSIVVTDTEPSFLQGLSDYSIQIPVTNNFLTTVLMVIPLQLLAYHIAVLRGCDVDQPRNLAKSVTVE